MKKFILQVQETAEKCAFEKVTEEREADVFIFSSDITYAAVEEFLALVSDNKVQKNCVVVLCTYGGDPHAAYRMARFLQDQYDKFELIVFGFCKSAGTLLALGAHEVIMGERAEFGPLDVQLHKPDEFMQRVSGLDITKALSAVSSSAFEAFQEVFIGLRSATNGVITTKTASEIAAQVVTGLFSPITQGIDPLKMGEMQRSMDIAVDYGTRLGASRGVVKRLAASYPTHSFVIDFKEATRIFPKVRKLNQCELELGVGLSEFFNTQNNEECLRNPSSEGVIAHLKLQSAEAIEAPTGNQNSLGEGVSAVSGQSSGGTTSQDTPQIGNNDGGPKQRPRRKRKRRIEE